MIVMAHKYTAEQLDFLKNNRPVMDLTELTSLFNKWFSTELTKQKINAACKNHGYKSGQPGRFRKGNIPWNKGLNGSTKINTGCFKPGHSPFNQSEVGTELLRDDGYLWVKIANPNKWIQKHRLLWINAHGEIPAGQKLMFIDGNPNNITLDNLELITSHEGLRLNQNNYRNTPEELKPLLKAVVKLEARVYERKGELL